MECLHFFCCLPFCDLTLSNSAIVELNTAHHIRMGVLLEEYITFIFQMKASVGNGAIAAEC